MSSDQAERPRQRRRSTTRKGRPTLTRDLIAHAMLDLAGRHGFRSVTMRLLAEHLGVTVRALYNYVDDRQELVDRAVWLFLEQWPVPELDPRQWERGIADYCTALRTLYRRYPRALLVSLDETVTATGVHPNRLLQADALLALLREIGLGTGDAAAVHRDIGMRVFAFVLLVDYRADLGEPVMEQSPVPPGWLAAHPDLAVPDVRAAVGAPPVGADADFARAVDDLVAAIARLRGQQDQTERDAHFR